MHRGDLSDTQWERLQPLLPPQKPWTGKPNLDHRTIINGILWIDRTGAPWRDLPEHRLGKWKTVYDYFSKWRADGTYDRILRALQVRLDKEGKIDWDLWCVDGSSIRASKAAAGAGKKGAAKNPQTTHWAARAADSGVKSTWSLTVTELPSRSISPQARRTSRKSSKRS